MWLKQFAKSARRRLGGLMRLAIIVGVVPLLVTGCFRSFAVIDHLDVQSGSSMIPSLRLGSGDGGVFCFVSPLTKGGQWSVTTWHDRDRDCPNVVMFLDVDARGSGFDMTVGYFGLILLSVGIVTWSWRRERRARAIATGGFEVRPIKGSSKR
jgi:hypothetical protein